MRTWTETHREGTDVGPVDWSHPALASVRPERLQLWKEAEKDPASYVFATDHMFWARKIYKVCMYDGWPYWEPRPAVYHEGVLGPTWEFINDRSLIQRAKKTEKE